jgi:S1-C subfamily serine protease
MIAGPGDSGAPVVDANGQVVGLVYGASQSETISLMIEDVKISFPEAF